MHTSNMSKALLLFRKCLSKQIVFLRTCRTLPVHVCVRKTTCVTWIKGCIEAVASKMTWIYMSSSSFCLLYWLRTMWKVGAWHKIQKKTFRLFCVEIGKITAIFRIRNGCSIYWIIHHVIPNVKHQVKFCSIELFQTITAYITYRLLCIYIWEYKCSITAHFFGCLYFQLNGLWN